MMWQCRDAHGVHDLHDQLVHSACPLKNPCAQSQTPALLLKALGSPASSEVAKTWCKVERSPKALASYAGVLAELVVDLVLCSDQNLCTDLLKSQPSSLWLLQLPQPVAGYRAPQQRRWCSEGCHRSRQCHLEPQRSDPTKSSRWSSRPAFHLSCLTAPP